MRHKFRWSIACSHRVIDKELITACNMASYKMLLALLVTLAVPAFTQASEVHVMQVQLEDLPTEFSSFEVRFSIC